MINKLVVARSCYVTYDAGLIAKGELMGASGSKIDASEVEAHNTSEPRRSGRAVVVGGSADISTPDVTEKQFKVSVDAMLKSYRKGRKNRSGQRK